MHPLSHEACVFQVFSSSCFSKLQVTSSSVIPVIHLFCMVLAEFSPAGEGIPASQCGKENTATEDTCLETVELSMYNNWVGKSSSIYAM